jgi:hypothetical protein
MKTHNNATFLVLSTDGEDAIVGLTENGEMALGTFDRFEWVARHIASSVLSSLDADIPLIIVVGKNKMRATAGEVFLEKLATAIVRAELAKLPESLTGYLAGTPIQITNSFFAPRVLSLALDWAPKSVALGTRVHRLLNELAFSEKGLDLLPKGRTHVGE